MRRLAYGVILSLEVDVSARLDGKQPADPMLLTGPRQFCCDRCKEIHNSLQGTGQSFPISTDVCNIVSVVSV